MALLPGDAGKAAICIALCHPAQNRYDEEAAWKMSKTRPTALNGNYHLLHDFFWHKRAGSFI